MGAQVFHDASAAGQYTGELPSSLVKREDGIYFKADAPAALLQAAVNQVYLSSAYFSGLDYGVFLRALYNAGPELPEGIRGQPLLRFADNILPFKPDRRDLYKSVRIVNGEAPCSLISSGSGISTSAIARLLFPMTAFYEGLHRQEKARVGKRRATPRRIDRRFPTQAS